MAVIELGQEVKGALAAAEAAAEYRRSVGEYQRAADDGAASAPPAD
jgi:hypothetical protein